MSGRSENGVDLAIEPNLFREINLLIKGDKEVYSSVSVEIVEAEERKV